ncbi:sensor histidine kinase [Psychroserpens sp. NJDZ02]|nr:sensor histidine kinase [Psychroserpens sp. NJDZ02]
MNFNKKIKNIKYYVLFFMFLIVGLVLLQSLLNNNNALEQQKIAQKLKEEHTNALNSSKAGIQVYASLVSSIKSYTKNGAEFPNEYQLQKYLKDLLEEIDFNDSILVSYVGIDHVFKYVITPNQIDPKNLKGVSSKTFISKHKIEELDRLMQSSDIRLFTPINLREGWAGFPFDFSARNNKNEILGYVAPVINVKYLLDYFYKKNDASTYVHKFIVNDSIDLTREVVYNDTEIFNEARDLEYYKNFDVKENDYIYSTIELFGLKLKIGSAYKVQPLVGKRNSNLAYFWYALISILVFITLYQFLKNRALNNSLHNANDLVVLKNKALEDNLLKIQTLIKEVHHRIKNNMQMVSGILLMQEDEYDDENIKKALRDSQNRIQSMSLVHEKLYTNVTLKEVKTKEYVEQLLMYVEDTLKYKSMQIDKEIVIDQDLYFDGDTSSDLGLIINELVTNSFKYAFKEYQNNRLSIKIFKTEDFYKLVYKDYGKGLPEQYDFKNAETLGMQLINILTEQLGGQLDYNKFPDSTFIISFKPLEKSFKE